MIYRGTGGGRGISLLLADHMRGAVDTSALRGAFCAILSDGSNVELLADAANMYSVFADPERGVLSSSLRATLGASGRQHRVKHEALLEQLVTGVVTGGDTCFSGVQRLESESSWKLNGSTIRFRRALAAPTTAVRCRNAGDCVDYQLSVLRDYFGLLRPLSEAGGVCMGLSGGYDSRLMLLLALQAGIDVSVHTYESSAHGQESCVAGRLASCAGVPLRKVAVRMMGELDDAELRENIDDALSYYDGRTSGTLGTFNDVHTRRNQLACVANAALNLNGLGGELYRNRERLPTRGFFAFRDWLAQYIIGPQHDRLFVSRSAQARFEDYLATKYGKLLGTNPLSQLDLELARRYYRDIWLPYHAGPRISAENQVCPSLMPFAEASVSAAALLATPFVGSHGEFEAAMIRRLDEEFARLPSIYGRGFDEAPVMQRLKDYAISRVPLSVRLARHRLRNRFLRCRGHNDGWCWRERFNAPLRLLKSLRLPVDLDHLLRDPVARDRTLYVAEFLYRSREFVDIGA